MTPPPGDEVRRIRDVYAGYDGDDDVVDRWSPLNPGNRQILAERRRTLAQLLQSAGVEPTRARVLEVGCGGGTVLAELTQVGFPAENLVGVDLVESRSRDAARRVPGARISVADATRLPFATSCFDVVLLYTVLSSVPDREIQRAIAGECTRVTRPDGWVVCYDLRVPSPGNPHVRAVGAAHARSLFASGPARRRTLTVVPPLVRRLEGVLPGSYGALRRLPFLRTHAMTMFAKHEAEG